TTDAAHAEPISLAILGFLGINAAAGSLAAGITTALLVAGMNIAVSLVQRALMGEPEKPKEPGVRLDIQIGDDNPIAFPIGKYATAGTRKYVGTYGQIRDTKNAYQVEVIQ